MPSYQTGIFFWLISFSNAYALYSTIPLCPLKITTTQHLAGTMAGWNPFFSEGVHFLDGVSFYSGDPKEQALLKPDSSTTEKAVWSFSSGDSIYMVCDYNQTTIHLSKAMPSRVTACQVIYDRSVMGAHGSIPAHIECE